MDASDRPFCPILNWSQLAQLRTGNSLQKAASAALDTLNLNVVLQNQSPELIGDVALGLDTPDKNIRILCACYDLQALEAQLKHKYWNRASLKSEIRPIAGRMTLLTRFQQHNFQVTISSQSVPVIEQRAYRIFCAELKLLLLVGKPLIDIIERQRAAGVATEFAFAEFFALEGEPKTALEKLDDMEKDDLVEFAHGQTRTINHVEPAPLGDDIPEELTSSSVIPVPSDDEDEKTIKFEIEPIKENPAASSRIKSKTHK